MNQTNPIATAPVKQLSITMGLPIMVSMALQAIYNIVDSIFVANIELVGEQATTALTLAYPIQMLMVSFTVGTGVGASVLLARCLGEGDREKASRVAGTTILLGLILTAIFVLFGLNCTRWYIGSQTDTALVLTMGIDYLSICCICSFGYVFFGMYEKLIQATGRTIYATIGQITGALVNMILDPILIYGWLGFEAYGVKGAAYATVIGQIASCLVCLYFYYARCHEIDKSGRYLRLSASMVKGIYGVGLPAIIAQGLTSVMTYALNLILGSVTETLITAYGLYYKVQYFILMMAYGLKDGTTPIISYALGMRHKQRIREGIKYSLLYTSVIMVVGLVLLELLATPFANLFGLTGEVREHYLAATAIASIGFLFAGVNIALQSAFQALGNGLYSVIVSLGRQFVFILPIAYGFSRLASADASQTWLIWTTFIIGEVLTMVIAIPLMKKTLSGIDRL